MDNYVVLSLETHLFFARIMKEHALFLGAGFQCVDNAWIQRAGWFNREFDKLLRDTAEISDGRVNKSILCSGELTTEFTIPAEQRTEHLSGVAIDCSVTRQVMNLCAGCPDRESGEVIRAVNGLNKRALRLVDGLIDFKTNILEEVGKGQLYNANYPLLIKHIRREAKLYRATVTELMGNKKPSYKNLVKTEEFWNQIMMEHAFFIRGLLDPSETELIKTAHQFARDYRELLEKARQQDCLAMGLTEKSLQETRKYRAFKAAGTAGILDCKIASVIMPLLADHVLREANHYIRLLETDCDQ